MVEVRRPSCARYRSRRSCPTSRRLQHTSTDMRGAICCCTPTLYCQSYGRTPHPLQHVGVHAWSSGPGCRSSSWPRRRSSRRWRPGSSGRNPATLVVVRVGPVAIGRGWYVTPGLLDCEHVSLFAGCRYLLTFTLQRRLAVAEQVVRRAHARRDVVVAGHAIRRGNVNGSEGTATARRRRSRLRGYQLQACS